MRICSLVVAMVLFLAATCWAGGFETTGRTDGYNVKVLFDKSHPTQGVNQIEITIADAELQPVRNAEVNVEYLMPSLPGKPPMMDYVTVAKPAGDRYVGTLNFSMKGEWKVVISIVTMAEAKRAEAMTFAFEVK